MPSIKGSGVTQTIWLYGPRASGKTTCAGRLMHGLTRFYRGRLVGKNSYDNEDGLLIDNYAQEQKSNNVNAGVLLSLTDPARNVPNLAQSLHFPSTTQPSKIIITSLAHPSMYFNQNQWERLNHRIRVVNMQQVTDRTQPQWD